MVFFTNQALLMLISLICISFVFIYDLEKHQLVPGDCSQLAYVFFYKGHDYRYSRSRRLEILSVYIYAIYFNLPKTLGLLPYSFTYTSHIAITGFLALSVFITVTVIGFIKNGFGFLSFLDKQCPTSLEANFVNHRSYILFCETRKSFYKACW